MEGKDTPKEFPDVSQKLAAPKKLSAFEKERQAAVAKQQRAEAEDAAALKDFEQAFAAGNDENEDDFPPHLTGGRGPPTGPRGPGMGLGGPSGRYGMPPAGSRSGPGSLGVLPGPPPPSLKRKRALDEMREAQEARREQEMLELGDPRGESRGSPQLAHKDEAQDLDAPRPTIQLSSLPPNIKPEEVQALLKDRLKVHSVRFILPPGPGSLVKRSVSAIVTLSSEVSTSQIDATVSALKDTYLGSGFYLSISRYLSSVALHPSMATNIGVPSAEPFGAEKPRDQQRFSMRNAPPPIDQRGFAPPDSYDTGARRGYGANPQPDARVSVWPPFEIEAIKAIHTVVDQLLLESNPERALETEAMLMALPEVQKDERFAFLYDSKSPAGVYYRFLLWGPEEQDDEFRAMKQREQVVERIHEDVDINWLPPFSRVPFPDLKSLDQAVADIDYNSSDEESDDEGGERQFNSNRDGDTATKANDKNHLTPLQRARLVYLLSRLPTSNARLRKGDVARVTNFAISHAGHGAEEIVDLLLLNVERPFMYSLASKYEDSEQEQDEEDVYEPGDDLSALDSPILRPQRDEKRDEDPSNAKLIALYLISDVLSASSTAGARNAWKYRQLFESGFKAQRTFEHLGKLDKELAWGRLKYDQWKRKVGVVFGIWEGWSVFSSDVHEELKESFFEPPMTEVEKAAALAEEQREEKKKLEEKWMGKFRKVGQADSSTGSMSPAPPPIATMQENAVEHVDSAPLDDIDGATLDDVDGAPMDDVDGMPMDDGAPIGGLDGAADEPLAAPSVTAKGGSSRAASKANGKPPAAPRKRMRAEDMFADSDDE